MEEWTMEVDTLHGGIPIGRIALVGCASGPPVRVPPTPQWRRQIAFTEAELMVLVSIAYSSADNPVRPLQHHRLRGLA